MPASTHSESGQDIISPKVQRELWKHRGEWAAIEGNRVIAYGSTPRQALKRALRKGSPDPLLHRVPDDGNNNYIL
jgi:hypothetical protein